MSFTGPTGMAGSSTVTFPMLDAPFTGSPVTCPGLVLETGELRVRAQGSTGGVLGGTTMFVITRDGDMSLAGPMFTSSTARIAGLLTLWAGMTVTGASSFDGEVGIGTLGILDGPDVLSPGLTMSSLINDGTMFIQGGFNSQVYWAKASSRSRGTWSE